MNNFKYLIKTSISLAVFLLVGGVALGCGGDDDDVTAPGQGGQSANTGSGGTTNTNTTGGTTGAAGSTAAATCVTTTTCSGSTSCDVSAGSTELSKNSVSMACLKACCTPDNKCGAQLTGMGFGAALLTGGSCVEANQNGNINTSCPNSLGADEDAGTTAATGPMAQLTNMFNYKGCCRPDGKCGLQLDKISLGCVANENIKDISAFFGNFVTAKTCKP